MVSDMGWVIVEVNQTAWLPNLVMTNSSPWYRWPIEIDGLPFLKMVDLSMAM
jgi:hypothetical protein